MVTDITITSLRCEYLTNPLGIDEVHTRLSWVLESDKRGQQQTAFQILVASSSERLAADDGDLWNSGKVISNQSVHVTYSGKSVQSRQRYWWKVRVWDQSDVPTPYSEVA